MDTLIKYRTYETIKTEAIGVRSSSDRNDWRLGDLCKELEDLGDHLRGQVEKDPAKASEIDRDLSKGSRVLLEKLADDIGLPKKSVFIRAKIARRIDPTGKLSWIRRSSLSYACVRELYAIPNDDDLDRIAKKAVSQQWTVRELRSEMDSYRDKKNVEAGLYICQTCNEPITDTSTLKSIRETGSPARPFCSWVCVGSYADKKMTEEGTIVYSSSTLAIEQEDDEGVVQLPSSSPISII